jgi:hypothetical protein
MQKDEIVMNTTKKFLTVPGSQAYPLVATTLGDFTGGLMQKFLLWLYSSESTDSFIKRSSKTCTDRDELMQEGACSAWPAACSGWPAGAAACSAWPAACSGWPAAAAAAAAAAAYGLQTKDQSGN